MSSSGAIAVGVGGGVVLIVALADLFVTIFNYDGFTFLTRRLHQGMWACIRAAARLLPARWQHPALSLGSALMLPATLAWWLGLEITAFAMMFLPGLLGGAFERDHVSAGIGAAYYLSGGDISSLTFGDLVARTGAYRALVDLETIIGLATFTLALTYVLTAFDALGSLNALHARVRRNTMEPARPETVLSRHFRDGQLAGIGSLLSALVDELDAYDQGLRRFPVVFYFHTRRLSRSTPRIFAALGEMVELLRWGLPPDRPITDDPSVLALLDGYSTTVSRLQRSFVGPDELADPTPVDRADFERRMTDNPGERVGAVRPDGDAAAVEEFRRLQATARQSAGLGDSVDDTQAAYEQYREWLPFHHRHTVFLHRLSKALGYPDAAAETHGVTD